MVDLRDILERSNTIATVGARNEPDLDDLPAAIRDEMTFHLVTEVDEVLRVALERQTEQADERAA